MPDRVTGFFAQFTPVQLIVAGVVLVAVVAIVIGIVMERRKKRTLSLRSRFGSEYDRAVVAHGSLRDAEAKLDGRQSRVDALAIRELTITERERFSSEWQMVQSRFVDHPRAAVVEANDLINAILEARGYPMAAFEQRAADLSVTYPRVMESYRTAHSVAIRQAGSEATTEELRTAMIQYRAMFDELAQPPTSLSATSAACPPALHTGATGANPPDWSVAPTGIPGLTPLLRPGIPSPKPRPQPHFPIGPHSPAPLASAKTFLFSAPAVPPPPTPEP